MSTLPRIAAPNGAPIFWKACITADPTPLRSCGNTESAVDPAVAKASPIPTPTRAIHAATKPSLDPTPVVAPRSIPAASSANPSATVIFAPTTRATRSAGTAPTTSPPISGKSRKPEPMASVQSTPWKNCGIVNSTPIMARIAVAARITPQVKEAERKSIEVHQWLASRTAAEPAFPEEESNQHHQACDHPDQAASITPTILSRLDQTIGHADQADGRGDHPDRVQAGTQWGARLWHERESAATSPTRATGTFSRNTQPHQ